LKRAKLNDFYAKSGIPQKICTKLTPFFQETCHKVVKIFYFYLFTYLLLLLFENALSWPEIGQNYQFLGENAI